MKPVNTTSFSASDASGPERPGPGAARSGGRRHLLLSRPPAPIRVAILDDHPVVALGVGAYLEMRQGFRSCTRKRRRGACWKSWPPRLATWR